MDNINMLDILEAIVRGAIPDDWLTTRKTETIGGMIKVSPPREPTRLPTMSIRIEDGNTVQVQPYWGLYKNAKFIKPIVIDLHDPNMPDKVAALIKKAVTEWKGWG